SSLSQQPALLGDPAAVDMGPQHRRPCDPPGGRLALSSTQQPALVAYRLGKPPELGLCLFPTLKENQYRGDDSPADGQDRQGDQQNSDGERVRVSVAVVVIAKRGQIVPPLACVVRACVQGARAGRTRSGRG